MIVINFNKPEFEYDVHSMVKAFFAKEDVEMYYTCDPSEVEGKNVACTHRELANKKKMINSGNQVNAADKIGEINKSDSTNTADTFRKSKNEKMRTNGRIIKKKMPKRAKNGIKGGDSCALGLANRLKKRYNNSIEVGKSGALWKRVWKSGKTFLKIIDFLPRERRIGCL